MIMALSSSIVERTSPAERDDRAAISFLSAAVVIFFWRLIRGSLRFLRGLMGIREKKRKYSPQFTKTRGKNQAPFWIFKSLPYTKKPPPRGGGFVGFGH